MSSKRNRDEVVQRNLGNSKALQIMQGTVVELFRQGVTKLFRQIEMFETLVFSYTYILMLG